MNGPVNLVGEHESIIELRQLIKRVAESKARNILIYGETGTGKGLVARMMHELSSRSKKEFIDVNCAAIPENLMESELFGFEKGAFTGAISQKTGLVEAADSGTIFFDEIRELAPVLQAKILSFLDRQEFRRVGAIKAKKVDARFIAATNKILSKEVRDGKFRDDLYYRLQVVAINIPPLRERGDDVLLLCQYFIRKFNARYDRNIHSIEDSVKEVFRLFHWPGNVRELENLMERIFILEQDDQILIRHIPPRIMRELEHGKSELDFETDMSEDDLFNLKTIRKQGFHNATSLFQYQIIKDALKRSNGNLTATAKDLQISRHALRHQISKLKITQ